MSTVAGAYTPGSGALSVVDGSVFGGAFPILVSTFRDSEPVSILEVVGRSGNTLSVSGAVDGTTDSPLVPGDIVLCGTASLYLEEIQSAVNAAEDQLEALDQALREIELTPGPPGEKGDKGDTGPNEITTGTSTPIEGALAGHGGFVRAAVAEDLPAHTHGDLVTLGTAQTVTGAKTFTETISAPRVDVGTTSIFTGQGGPALLAVRYSDTPFQYPYFALRVAGGTEADPQDVQAGRWSGGFLTYARFKGIYQGVGSVVAQVTDASGDFLKGRLAFQVNAGTDGGANLTVASMDPSGITLYRDTAVQGSLSATGTISGDGSGLTGVAKPADLAALARPVPYTWGGLSPAVGVKTEARVRVPHAGAAAHLQLSATGTRTGDCTIRVLRSTDGGTTFDSTVGEITLSDSQDHDYKSLSVALTAGDYLCPEVVEVGGAATWSLRLSVLSTGA